MAQEIEVIEKINEQLKVNIPKLYKVILHNDNTTTVECPPTSLFLGHLNS